MLAPLFLSFLGLASSYASPLDFKSRCEALGQGVHADGYSDVSVNIAQYLTKDTVLDQFADGTNVTCTFPNPVLQVNLCRVVLRIPTTDSSEVYMEAWLPEEWNSRLLAIGTGGLAGCIFYQELAYVTKFGFASVSGNSGHNGTSGGAFYQKPDVLEDFVWRALYATTEVGKSVTNQFYGKPQKKSYFIGCSQGGRQGFKAAQFSPELFDGIVAGAPGLRLPGLFQQMTRWILAMGTDANNLTIPLEKWSAVQNETLRQCDNLDGANDGIIEDTRLCKPDISKLLCGNEKPTTETCLTADDISLIIQLFSSWTVNGTLIYPGVPSTGNELARAQLYASPEVLGYALEWPRFVSRSQINWTLDDWTPADASLAVNQNFFGFNTLDGDLSAFRERGAKIIHYHGQMDQTIDSTVSDGYYEHVAATLDAQPGDLDAFYRYFRVSGLGHCQGGTGAASFGQAAGSPAASEGAEDDVLAAIVRWVEDGEAPVTLRGTKFVGDGSGIGEVEYQRKHCKYPERNVYEGEGDGKDEEGWRCVI